MSVFEELSFLALLLMAWQKTLPQEDFKKTKTWNGINGTFRQEQNTGHETQEIKFSFPLDT